MSFRFQKRVRIAPGVRLNISKGGVSTSVGRRGASVTVGKRGIYGNAGIPGSGLSYRSKLVKTPNNDSKRKRTTVSRPTFPTSPPETGIQIKWDNKENDFIFLTEAGTVLRNEKERHIRKIYYTELQSMYKEKVTEINERTLILLQLHHRIFEDDSNIVKTALNSVVFDKKEPLIDEIHQQVYTKSLQRLSLFQRLKLFLPRYKKHFHDEVKDKSHAIFTTEYDSYIAEKKKFTVKQANLEKLAIRVMDADKTAMEEWIGLFLNELDFPLETDVDFQITSSRQVYLDIDLPTLEEVPIKKASLLKTGRIKLEDKTQREHREDYAILVGGTAFYLASFFFHYLPTIDEVVISGYNQITDNSTGHKRDQYIYSLRIDRKTLYSFQMKNVHPIKAFEHFQPILNVTKTYIFKEINPYEP